MIVYDIHGKQKSYGEDLLTEETDEVLLGDKSTMKKMMVIVMADIVGNIIKYVLQSQVTLILGKQIK